MAVAEVRTLHRALAAFPDLLNAALLLVAWWFPLWLGREGVYASMALLAMELPALGALAALFMLYTQRDFFDKAKAAILLIITLGFFATLTARFLAMMPSVFLVAAAFLMLYEKWLIFATTKRQSTWVFEGMKLTAHLIAFAMIALLIADMPIPRGGFDAATIEALDLPGILDSSDPARNYYRSRSVFDTPWTTLVLGILYFLFSAAFRYFFSVKEEVKSNFGIGS